MEHLEVAQHAAAHVFQNWNIAATMTTFGMSLALDRLGLVRRLANHMPHRHDRRVTLSNEVVLRREEPVREQEPAGRR